MIDVHAHFLSADYVAAAIAAGITHPDGMPTWPSWNLQDHLSLMNDTGIRHSVLSMSSPGVYFGAASAAADLARHVNDFAHAVVDGNPDRFSFFASMPLPDVDEAVIEAQRALDRLGAVGVVLMSNSDGHYLGDVALNPLWQQLDARGSIVFVHPTSPPDADTVSLGRPRPMIEFMFETTRTVTDLIFAGVPNRYPNIRFVIPHCGALVPLLAKRIELFRSLWPGPDGEPPLAMTTEEHLKRFWYDLAGYPLPTHAGVLQRTVGDQQILYGSDFCWTPAFAVHQQISALTEDPDVDYRHLTTDNAARLLGVGRDD